jgi:CheY-like chemotaxis protein
MSHNPQTWTKEWAKTANDVFNSCPKCLGTGTIDTGNNDLPCDCEAGDRALFNEASVGLVTGAECKRHYHNGSPEPLDTLPNRGYALVVDDDRQEREYVAGILRKNGFSVVEAQNGADGFKRWFTHPEADGNFAIVVSDWSMPEVMGTEMVINIRRFRPEQKVLMMSTEPEGARRILRDEGIFDVKVLFKDFEPEDMMTAVLKTIVGEVVE